MHKYRQFIKVYPGCTKEQARLSRYCTMKVGGPADLLVEANTPDELISAVKLSRKLGIRYFVLAGGSNIIFDDRGFRGLVIRYLADQVILDPIRKVVEVGAGCRLSKLVKQLADKNFGGIDFLANIPGSVGGAVVGNAGCYGQDVSHVLKDATIFNVKTSRTLVLPPQQLGFTYRNSKLKQKPHLLVLSARLKVNPDRRQRILKVIEKERQLRWVKHPHAPSVGSFFKNPPGIAAWKLIDAAGMRGVTLGGARVSAKHSNHLINYRRAKAKDILKLAAKVRSAVRAKTGVVLEPEARFISETGAIT
ncbi:UDP-N-acetylenolpyruvoylglucosamine reductase [candidate division Kazan bacterium RBG_13_50_9]|uniref:UDP-N-acetylenolpyruvoylglucosamine reductase n=1 Tax=candidate division Kazan bacterium RBG_13_50_9 TaxID=1798535 RepID=A0A1F4NRX8_UNCK3|nr:MAG: UDP-N-acetylenolpyruvoylglucosamine reductase [candidate division Kazan bacterium RBG_13_50_9]